MNFTQMNQAIGAVNSTANAIDANSMLNSLSSASDLNYQRSQIEAQKLENGKRHKMPKLCSLMLSRLKLIEIGRK